MTEIAKEAVSAFFLQRKGLETAQIDWDKPIADAGYLDSLGTIELLMHVEQNLDVELPLSEMLEDFPTTLNNLLEVISSAKA